MFEPQKASHYLMPSPLDNSRPSRTREGNFGLLASAFVITCGVLLAAGCTKPTPPPKVDAPDSVPMTKLVKPKQTETVITEPTADGSQIDAEQVLATALATAKSDNKRVLVHLGAPW